MNESLERAVAAVCRQVRTAGPSNEWATWEEPRLFFELVSCILGSRVSYTTAGLSAERLWLLGLCDGMAAVSALTEYELAIRCALEAPLQDPDTLRSCHYRFPRSRARQIARTALNVYAGGGTLKRLLHSCQTAKDARRSIGAVVTGAGPKQSSLFLRNVGFSSDLAVLDSHVLRYMETLGLIRHVPVRLSTLRTYESVENDLRAYALRLGEPLGQLDQAIWVVMRVYSGERDR